MMSSRISSLPRIARQCRHFATARDTSASHLHSPAVYVMLRNEKIDPSSIIGTGKAGRIQKGDIILAIKAGTAKHLEHNDHHQATQTSSPVAQSSAAPSATSAARLTASGRRTRVSLASILQQLNSAPESPVVKSAPAEPATYQRRNRRGWTFKNQSA